MTSFETTLTRLRHLAQPGDYMLPMTCAGRLILRGIAPDYRDYLTADYDRGKFYRLAGLPVRWSLSPYY